MSWEGSAPKAAASLRIVEKFGSTSFFSVLTNCLEEIPVAWVSCSCGALVAAVVEGSERCPVLCKLLLSRKW